MASSDLHKPDPPHKKNQTHIRIAQNGAVTGRVVAWGGAFAFALALAAATFRRSKKIGAAKRSKDDAGSGEGAARCGGEAPQMEGLRLLLRSSSSTDFISSCRTAPEMPKKKAFHEPTAAMTTASVEHVSLTDSDSDENRTPAAPEPIGEKNEDDKIVVIIYEEGQYAEYLDSDSEKSLENYALKYEKIPKVHDDEATWPAAEWKTDESSSEVEENGDAIDVVIELT